MSNSIHRYRTLIPSQRALQKPGPRTLQHLHTNLRIIRHAWLKANKNDTVASCSFCRCRAGGDAPSCRHKCTAFLKDEETTSRLAEMEVTVAVSSTQPKDMNKQPARLPPARVRVSRSVRKGLAFKLIVVLFLADALSFISSMWSMYAHQEFGNRHSRLSSLVSSFLWVHHQGNHTSQRTPILLSGACLKSFSGSAAVKQNWRDTRRRVNEVAIEGPEKAYVVHQECYDKGIRSYSSPGRRGRAT